MSSPPRTDAHVDTTPDSQTCGLPSNALDALRRLFQKLDISVPLRLWDGTVLALGSPARLHAASGSEAFTLVCRSPAAVRALVLGRDPLRLAEMYFHNDIDIEGNFFSALQLKDHLKAIRLSWRDRFRMLAESLRFFGAARAGTADDVPTTRASLQGTSVRHHSRSENRNSVAFHYDLSNAFYALWLDPAMVYSCAYFQTPEDGIAAAQTAKLDLICRKLRLRPGDRFLDVGCGWGALVIHAARHYGVRASGITLSRQQLLLARQRIAQAGLIGQADVELRDYRDLEGESVYDKVASVGMFEHIGLKQVRLYCETVHRLLKPGGLFLNHGITHDVEGWKKTISSEFINRYVFPDGQLDTISNLQRAMESCRFEIADVESLRTHYALTLRRWVAALEQHHQQALEYVSEATWRVWRLYMSACAMEFESGEIGVYQVLASKRDRHLCALPLTRQDLYRRTG